MGAPRLRSGRTRSAIGTHAVIELFASAFVTFFVVIDPPGCAPIFASLTRDATPAHRRAMAIRSTAVAAAILLFFALLGEALLRHLGISLAAFRIAGGIMLFLIALEMVFEKRTQRRESRAQEVSADPEHDDISVFPMGIPMIAGPGSIASVMLLMARTDGLQRSLVVLAALGAILLMTLAALLAAGWLMRLLGNRMEAMLTRLLGVILAALAAQFVIDGISVSFQV
jgi:multiple antibiotic resistance protein